MDDALKVLSQIAKAKQDLDEAEAELVDAKAELHDCPEWEDHQDAKEKRDVARSVLDGMLGKTRSFVQLPLDAGEVLRDVAQQVNEGALDGDGVTCTATVGVAEMRSRA